MNLFLFFCLVSVLATSYDDEKIELEPVDDPFPCLSRGSLEEVMPEENDDDDADDDDADDDDADDDDADDPESRIFRGSYATEGQLPYQAGLLIESGTGHTWCGGAILSTEWILTTAQCIAGAKSVKVHLGSIKKQTPLLITYSLETHVHPDWKQEDANIALIRVQQFDFNAYVAAAVLSKSTSIAINASVTASGWGDYNDLGSSSVQLKYITLPVAEKSVCIKVYGELANRDPIICTLTKGFGSTCNGDLGGPLVLKNTTTLVGLMSFGHRAGCTLGYPVVFTSISHYLDWIHDVSGVTSQS